MKHKETYSFEVSILNSSKVFLLMLKPEWKIQKGLKEGRI